MQGRGDSTGTWGRGGSFCKWWRSRERLNQRGSLIQKRKKDDPNANLIVREVLYKV